MFSPKIKIGSKPNQLTFRREEMKEKMPKAAPIPKKPKPVASIKPMEKKIEKTKKLTSEESTVLKDDNEQMKIMITRKNSENVQLTNLWKEAKEKETLLLNKVLPAWKSMYAMESDFVKSIANELSVNPDSEENGKNMNSIEHIFTALMRTVYYQKPDVEALQWSLSDLQRKLKEKQERMEFFQRKAESLEEKVRALQEEKQNWIIEQEEKQTQVEETNLEVKEEEEVETEVEPIVETESPSFDEVSFVEVAEMEETEEELNQEETEEELQEEDEENDEEIVDLSEPYMIALQEKGYEPKPSMNEHHSCMITYKNEEYPLCYIKEEVKDSDIFDSIMENTKEVFFLFNNDKTSSKVNSQFTRWKLMNRKNNIRFSFTTEDKLIHQGLNRLG